MANIYVDTSKLKSTAGKIDSRVSGIKSKMNSANSKVTGMSAYWSGRDYTSFKNQWNTVSNNGSRYQKTIKALESYSTFLTFSANSYEAAQQRAQQRARSLPR